jgi:hypothetical protein
MSTRTPRRCSFCNDENHNILHCESPEIQIIMNDEKYYVQRMIMVPEHMLDELVNVHLQGKTLRELRIIGREYHLRMNLTINTYVRFIKEQYIQEIQRLSSIYFRNIYRGSELSEIDDIDNVDNRDIEEMNDITGTFMNMFLNDGNDTPYTLDNHFQRVINGTIDYNQYSENIHVSIEEPDLITSLLLHTPANRPSGNYIKPTHKIPSVCICIEETNELEQLVECPICLDEKQIFDSVQLNCNHSFCVTCIIKHMDITKINQLPNCPLCRTDIKMFEVKSIETYNLLQDKYNS